MKHRLSLLFILSLAICSFAGTACQQNAATVTAPAPVAHLQVPPSALEEDVDLSCSYFYFLWGRHATLRLQFDEAMEAYEKAFICDPNAEEASEKIPILMLRLERTIEAKLWLQNYLSQHPDNVNLRMLYARVLLSQQDTEQAMLQYQIISKNHPNDPAIMLPLAEMYLSKHETAKTREILDQILTQDPNSYQGNILMARFLRTTDDPLAALNYYQKALAANWSAEIQGEEAELLAQGNDYSQAERLYRDILDKEEQNESASLGLVRLYLLQNKDDKALEELYSLREISENQAWVDLAIARLYVKQQKYAKAKELAEKIVRQNGLTEARFLLAALLKQEKNYQAALRQVRLIDHKAPEFLDALSLHIDILTELNRVDDAILLLERNIANSVTRHPAMYRLLADLHDSQGRSSMARKVFEQGLVLYPENEDLRYTYGLYLESKGENDAALQEMEKIIAINPDNAAALNYVGYSWADANTNLPEALQYLQKAVALTPENGYSRDSLGWVYYRLGKWDDALLELEKANAIIPNDPAILDHLAEVYMTSGNTEKALPLYKTLLRLYIDSKNETAEQNTLNIIHQLEQAPSP